MAAFYIQNPWTGLVIDIGENAQKPSPGTLLRANAKKTSAPGNAYQLWTFSDAYVPTQGTTNIPYYWLENANPNLTGKTTLVIDIAESGNTIWISAPGGGRTQTIKEGSPLDAWTPKSGQAGDLDDAHPAASNQLWYFVQDTASGYYYIINWLTNFVIDIAEGGSGQQPGSGAHLDAYAKKGSSPENKNQLWQFVDVNGATVSAPSEKSQVNTGTVAANPGGVQR